jgi:pyruvate carboxylase subunit B
MLDNCHAIEAYFGFPKPNETVKNAEVPGGMYSNMVAQLKALNSSDLLDDAMKLIPKVRRDAGLVPLVTPTSQIVGAQAVNLAIDRKKGNPDYTNTSNQFISLVKGEYGHTPAAIDPAFRAQITGDAVEHPYDVSKYRKPEIPTVAEFGGVKLATNTEEELLMELLPNVANKFLRNRREEEFKAKQPKEAPAAAAPAAAPAAKAVDSEPITGEVFRAPMGGRIIEVHVKAGDKVSKGQVMLVYEAMKMENDLEAERDLTVKRVFVAVDEVVGTDAPLIEFE